MDKFKWLRVSADSPCPICKKTDWCRVSCDGTLAACMRVEAGAFKVKDGRDGSRVFLHRLAEAKESNGNPLPSPGQEAKRADADTLNSVYSAFLERLTLSDAHREALGKRGLPEDAIEQASYRTLPVQGRARIAGELRECFKDRLLRVPGFVVKEGKSGRYVTLRGSAGLLIPCRDRAGRIAALKVRRDDAGTGGSRYHYLSSAGHGGPGSGAPIHVSLGTPESVGIVRLTEGELKADVIQARTGLPTVSIPGVSSWRQAIPVLKSLDCKTVRLAFDMDGWDNPSVARAMSDCAAALREAGLAVELERWQATDGKGLDDLLANGKTPELLQGEPALQAVRDILASATAGEEPAEPDELERLQGVLDAGGAEALFRDSKLMQALAELATTDPARFAAVKASIRERVSLRDLEVVLRPLRRQVESAETPGSRTYFEESGCICRSIQTKDGPVVAPLCNFSARIVEEVVHDDGAEQSRRLAVEGTLTDGTPLPRAEVPAADFGAMNWTVPAWGTRAVVLAGLGTRDHLRAALQLLSGNVPRRTIYGHTGWRLIDGAWHYLHAGGAIGPTGLNSEIAVSLPEPLAGFQLPEPPRGTELREAVSASLGLLRLGPDRLVFPLLAAVYRAALGNTDFGLHASGPTGSFKSEAAALAQQHFGTGMNARHLPASWSSTGNALEALAFAAQDALLVVDDFCPTGSSADVQRYHREADRLLRGQGNRSGRQRMRADASLRPSKPPRGLVLSTGEDTPRGQSLRARMLVLEVSPGDLGPLPPKPNPSLTACQKDAAAGKYSAAMAGFLAWLAPQYGVIRARIPAEVATIREQAASAAQHARTPGIVAELDVGLHYFFNFAQAAGAISETERADLTKQGWAALTSAAAEQSAHIASADAAVLFLRLLAGAVASGRAHLASPTGNAPANAQRWGWRVRTFGSGEDAAEESVAQGRRIGWTEGALLYLEPEAAFAEACELARQQGDGLSISSRTLWRRLKERGCLAECDERRQRNTVRRTMEGVQREVIALGGDILSSVEPSKPSRDTADTEKPSDGDGLFDGQSNCWPGEPPIGQSTANGTNQAARNGTGRFGRSEAVREGITARDPESTRSVPRTDGVVPPPGAKFYYLDDKGCSCDPARGATWTWEGGPQWYSVVDHPPPTRL